MSRLGSSGVMVSVIMPAYNEEDRIGKAIGLVGRSLESLGVEYEVLVVDDGSGDGTRRVASECAGDGRVRSLGMMGTWGRGSL